VGTEFNVVHQQGDVSVAVRRGVVEVRPAGDRHAAPLARLTRGKALSHHKGETIDRVKEVDPDLALAWTTGRLVFQDEPLVEVARTLSRYGERPVSVAPDAGAMRVTAVLDIASQETMLHSLSEFLPVRIDSRADSVRLSLRR
jgi:transmembrane sensor